MQHSNKSNDKISFNTVVAGLDGNQDFFILTYCNYWFANNTIHMIIHYLLPPNRCVVFPCALSPAPFPHLQCLYCVAGIFVVLQTAGFEGEVTEESWCELSRFAFVDIKALSLFVLTLQYIFIAYLCSLPKTAAASHTWSKQEALCRSLRHQYWGWPPTTSKRFDLAHPHGDCVKLVLKPATAEMMRARPTMAVRARKRMWAFLGVGLMAGWQEEDGFHLMVEIEVIAFLVDVS